MKRFTGFTSGFLFFYILVCMTAWLGCKESGTTGQDKDGNKTKIDTIAFKNKFFELKLDEYYGIVFSNKNAASFDFINSIISNSDQPISFTVFENFSELFVDCYKYNVNSNIHTHDFEIPWAAFKTFSGFNSFDSTTPPNIGFAFFYLINNSDTSHKYFTYVITKATIDSTVTDSIRPLDPYIIGGIEYYLMLNTSEAGYQLIPKTDFVNYYKAYKNLTSVSRKNTIYDIDTIKHPRICFQSGKNLYHLFHDNKGLTIENGLKVKFINGAKIKQNIFSNGPQTNGVACPLYVQSPLTILKYNNKPLLNDSFYRDKYDFKMKALNVGRLCPPECN